MPKPDAQPDETNEETPPMDAGADALMPPPKHDAGSPTATCVPGHEAERFAAMMADPILPGQGGGLRLRHVNDDDTGGLTVSEALTANCQAIVVDNWNEKPGDKTLVWGKSDEVSATYNPTTKSIRRLVIDHELKASAYTGALTFKSEDGAHTYVIRLGVSTTLDGQPVVLDWANDGNEAVHALYRGMMATFAPNAPRPERCTPPSCMLLDLQGEESSLDVMAVHIGIVAQNKNPSIFTRVFLDAP